MSNRVRVLFHCGMEGNRAHIGRDAVLAMQKYTRLTEKHGAEMPGNTKGREGTVSYLMDVKYPWIVPMPQAPFRREPVERVVRKRQKGPRMKAEDAVPFAELPLGRQAQSVWNRLPPEIQACSQLFVVREHRSSNWRKSPANPARYGWNIAKGKNSAYAGLSGALEVVDVVPSVSPVTVAGKIAHASAQLWEKKPNLPKLSAKYKLGKNSPSSAPVALSTVQEGQAGGGAGAKTTEKKPKLKLGIWV